MRADCRKAPRPPAIERRAAPDCRKAEALPWRHLWARADRDAPWPSPWLWVRGRAGPPWPLLLPLRSIAEPGTGGPPAESPWTAESGSRSEVSGGGWEWRPGRRPRQSEWPGGRRRPSGRRTGPAGEEPPRQGPGSFSMRTSHGDASHPSRFLENRRFRHRESSPDPALPAARCARETSRICGKYNRRSCVTFRTPPPADQQGRSHLFP